MLFLTKNDYDKVLKHCEAGLPDEACGLIGGTKEGNDKYIKKVYLLTNIDHSNEHFSMDPKEQLQFLLAEILSQNISSTYLVGIGIPTRPSLGFIAKSIQYSK